MYCSILKDNPPRTYQERIDNFKKNELSKLLSQWEISLGNKNNTKKKTTTHWLRRKTSAKKARIVLILPIKRKKKHS